MNGKYKLFHPKPTPIAAKIAEEWRDLLTIPDIYRPLDSIRKHLPMTDVARDGTLITNI